MLPIPVLACLQKERSAARRKYIGKEETPQYHNWCWWEHLWCLQSETMWSNTLVLWPRCSVLFPQIFTCWSFILLATLMYHCPIPHFFESPLFSSISCSLQQIKLLCHGFQASTYASSYSAVFNSLSVQPLPVIAALKTNTDSRATCYLLTC